MTYNFIIDIIDIIDIEYDYYIIVIDKDDFISIDIF